MKEVERGYYPTDESQLKPGGPHYPTRPGPWGFGGGRE